MVEGGATRRNHDDLDSEVKPLLLAQNAMTSLASMRLPVNKQAGCFTQLNFAFTSLM